MNRVTTEMDSDTRSAETSPRGGCRGLFSSNRVLGLALLASLGGVTVWNVTRSDALTAAEKAYQRGNDAKALGLALDHLNRRPWSRAANLVAARALWRLQDGTRAEPYAMRAGPLERDDQHRRGSALRMTGRLDQAAAVYQSIESKWPDDTEAVRELAVIRKAQGRDAEALELAHRLTQADDAETQVIGFTLLGTFSSDLREFDRVVSSYDNVLKRDPQLRWVPVPRKQFWIEYARALLETGQSDRANRSWRGPGRKSARIQPYKACSINHAVHPLPGRSPCRIESAPPPFGRGNRSVRLEPPPDRPVSDRLTTFDKGPQPEPTL